MMSTWTGSRQRMSCGGATASAGPCIFIMGRQSCLSLVQYAAPDVRSDFQAADRIEDGGSCPRVCARQHKAVLRVAQNHQLARNCRKGRDHVRPLAEASQKAWLDELPRNRSRSLDAPSWLWNSVVDLIRAHETAYIGHCRLYARRKLPEAPDQNRQTDKRTQVIRPMVLLEGIELSTSPLPRECSTTELQQRAKGARRLHRLQRLKAQPRCH